MSQELLEDAEWPDTLPNRYVDEPNDPGSEWCPRVPKAAALVLCVGRALDDARRFNSRAEAVEAERRGCTVPNCSGKHTVVFRDGDGQVRAVAWRE